MQNSDLIVLDLEGELKQRFLEIKKAYGLEEDSDVLKALIKERFRKLPESARRD
jgi:hypothetical protein